jgi:DNA-directed RNA polymerase subunit RPC12/RpoP
MAIEKTLSAKLDELAIVLICDKCKTRVTYPLKSWQAGTATHCPNCRHNYDSEELSALKSALQKAISGKLPVEIRLEFTDQPESKP